MCDMNAVETHLNTVVLAQAGGADAAGAAAAAEVVSAPGGIAGTIASIAMSDWYVMFCMAVMVLPMIAIAIWYHGNIAGSEGGRELMQRQNAKPVKTRGSPNDAVRNVEEGVSMARDIESGRYGQHAKTMQHKVYRYVGLWLLANAVAFGLLIWAVNVTRAPGVAL